MGFKGLLPKSEFLNQKSDLSATARRATAEPISKFVISKLQFPILFPFFRVFEFVQDFDIRASDFGLIYSAPAPAGL